MKYKAYYDKDNSLCLLIEGLQHEMIKLQRCANAKLGQFNKMYAQLIGEETLEPVYELRVTALNQNKLEQLFQMGLNNIPMLAVLKHSADAKKRREKKDTKNQDLNTQEETAISSARVRQQILETKGQEDSSAAETLDETSYSTPEISSTAAVDIKQPNNLALFIGEENVIDDFAIGFPKIDLIGNYEHGFALEDIPKKHYDAVMINAHGLGNDRNTPKESHVQMLNKHDIRVTIDTVFQIMKSMMPSSLHLLSCFGGAIGNDLEKHLDGFAPIMKAGNLEHVTISVAASSKHSTQRPFVTEYIKAVAGFNESKPSWLQTVSIMRNKLPETLKQYHLYRYPETDKMKMFVFKIRAPKNLAEFQHPDQFIGSHAMYGDKVADKAKRTLVQVVTERGDERDEVYLTLQKQLLAELTDGEKRFSDEYIQNAMLLFIQRDKPELVAECIKQGARADFTYLRGDTGLHSATSAATAEILLSSGANVNTLNCDQVTPLHFAASHGQTEVAEKLLEYGAIIDAQNNKGDTPLHAAASYNKRQVAEKLIALGANINAINHKGCTILREAASGGCLSVVLKLIDLKVNVHATNVFGETALHLAVSKGHQNIVRALIEAGAKVNVFTNRKQTPLCVAVVKNFPLIVDELLLKRADVNAADDNGVAPVLVAAQLGHTEILRKLLAVQGINLDASYKNNGCTALHLAAYNGNMDAVKELLTHGASPIIRNKEGYKASDMTTNREIRAALEDAEEAFAQSPGQGSQLRF